MLAGLMDGQITLLVSQITICEWGAIQTDVELNLANSPDKGATTWLIR
jgi:hypothetical protein